MPEHDGSQWAGATSLPDRTTAQDPQNATEIQASTSGNTPGAEITTTGRSTRSAELRATAARRARDARTSASLVRAGAEHRRRERTVEYALRHFHVDGDPDRPVRGDLVQQYEQARAARLREANNQGGWASVASTVQQYGAPGALAFGDAMAVGGAFGAWWPVPLLASAAYLRWVWCRLRDAGERAGTGASSTADEIDPAAAADSARVGAEFITAALRDAGVLAAPTSANPSGEAVTLAAPVQHDEHGWVARLVLPSTVAASRVAKAHERLTGALGAGLVRQQVVVTIETPRVISLRVYRHVPFTGDPVPHPLLRGGPVDVARDGVPVGLDINGQPVHVDLQRGLHGIVAAASGMGKTVHLQNLIISLLADPNAEVGGVFDGKSSGDYDALRADVGWYVDDAEYPETWWGEVAERLEMEVAEARSRQQRIRRGERPALRVVILDEFQRAFGKPGQRTKDSPATRCLDAVETLSRLGRSAQVRFVLASQSWDGNVLPAAIENNILWRVVGWLNSQNMPPERALGEDAGTYSLDTGSLFTREQRGAAVVISPGISTYATCRGWYESPDEIERVRQGRRPAAADDQGDQADGEPAEDQEDGEHQAQPAEDLPELLAALDAYVRECTGGGDDRSLIPTGELHEHANPRAMSLRAYGDALAELGIPKYSSDPDTGRTLRSPARSVADIRKAVLTSRSARRSA